jgi:hypothetical protein
MTHDFLFGYTTVVEIPSSGVHRPQQPEFSSAEINKLLSQMEATNNKHLSNVTSQVRASYDRTGKNPTFMASLRSTWDVTEGEIRDGWMSKVMTEEEVLTRFGKDAFGEVIPLRSRVIHRYGIVQGKKFKKQQDGTIKEFDKVRCIDDCRSSGHNACQLTHETITTCHYDFLSYVTDEIYHQCVIRGQKLPFTLVWRADDMRSVYR